MLAIWVLSYISYNKGKQAVGLPALQHVYRHG